MCKNNVFQVHSSPRNQFHINQPFRKAISFNWHERAPFWDYYILAPLLIMLYLSQLMQCVADLVADSLHIERNRVNDYFQWCASIQAAAEPGSRARGLSFPSSFSLLSFILLPQNFLLPSSSSTKFVGGLGEASMEAKVVGGLEHPLHPLAPPLNSFVSYISQRIALLVLLLAFI